MFEQLKKASTLSGTFRGTLGLEVPYFCDSKLFGPASFCRDATPIKRVYLIDPSVVFKVSFLGGAFHEHRGVPWEPPPAYLQK